eukprot:CAMPEP_0172388526 /NCGR_PEP_ID=MMETSP1061-20121228/5610_1 /TAXON_ID=37318 /ORGANISM="Pseudo-nitzschia pungens, Strain cf. pungens" /LENGTH=301 /DNA_ID=CAMNT_0013118441 /DNA_START=283 /DNA_END=1188 /DNA_ORIENTATION=-
MTAQQHWPYPTVTEDRNPTKFPRLIERRSSRLISPTSTLTTSMRTMWSDAETDHRDDDRQAAERSLFPPQLAPVSPLRSSHSRASSQSSSCCHGIAAAAAAAATGTATATAATTGTTTTTTTTTEEEYALFNLTQRASSPKGKEYRNYFCRHASGSGAVESSSLTAKKHAFPRVDGTGFDLAIPSSKQFSAGGGSDRNSKYKYNYDHNYNNNDDVHPRKGMMKKQRKRKTLVGTIGGMVVGGAALGPVGVVLGALCGGIVTREVAKKGEKRAQRKHEQKSFQRSAHRKARHWNESGSAVYV